jgi:hypothetical protein
MQGLSFLRGARASGDSCHSCGGVYDGERMGYGSVRDPQCQNTVQVVVHLALPGGRHHGSRPVQLGSLPKRPHCGKLVLLVAVRGGLWVPVREVAGADPPVRAPLLLSYVEGCEPLSLSLDAAREAVEGDSWVFHR